MRPLLRWLRFVLKLQGAVVTGGRPRPADGTVEIEARRRCSAKPRCPVCRRALTGRIIRERREWWHLDLIGQKTVVVSEIREGYCKKYGRRVERIPWAAPGSRHTHAFDEAVASLVQVADKTAVGDGAALLADRELQGSRHPSGKLSEGCSAAPVHGATQRAGELDARGMGGG